MAKKIDSQPSILRDPADRAHLLRRLTFAATPSAERSIQGLTVKAAYRSLVDAAKSVPQPETPASAQGTWTNGALRFKDTTNEEIAAKRKEVSASNRRGSDQLRQWWLNEMIAGPAPLRENLVLFFHSVLGGSSRVIDGPHALYGYNALLRRSCFGTIPDLVESLVLNPGMIMQESYDETRKEAPSEFSASRILDNWTVGVGNYTSDDTLNLARAITGWVLEGPEPAKPLDPRAFRSNKRTGLTPVFHADLFDDKPKTILGKTQNFGARDSVRFLAMHDLTARRYGKLFVRYFGVDDPKDRLAQQLAETYRTTGGSIEALLEGVVLSDEFWSAESRWSLIKSPVHLVVSVGKALDLRAPLPDQMTAWFSAAGQVLLDAPNFGGEGWPGQDAWLNPPDRLAARYQLGAALVGESSPWGLNPAHDAKAAPASAPIAKSVENLSVSALVARLDPAPGFDVRSLEQKLQKVPQAQRAPAAIREILASPEYQLA